MSNLFKLVMILTFFILSTIALYAKDDVKFYNLEKEYKKLVTKEVKIKKAEALELKLIVQNMLSIYGSVYVNEKNNTLYITDTQEMIDNLTSVIAKLDIDNISAGGNLATRIVLLNHTNGSDIINLVKHKLSNEGSIISVGDLNGLLITDIKSKIDEAEKLIGELDVTVKHLAIEINILEINSEQYERIGIDPLGWLEKVYPDISYLKDKDFYKYQYDDPDQDGYSSNSETEQYNIRIPARFQIADIIEAMVRDGKGKVIASPKIITKNNNSAYLNTSEMIPYTPEDNYSSERSVRAGVYVSVLPIIQQDNYINLSITPTISDFTGWSPKGMPIIFERSLRTEVNVKDGETFVLGGLKKTEKVNQVKGIPLLKNIPVIKYLFSKTEKADLTREIVMFIKPMILEDNQSASDTETMEKLKEQIK